jgi:hypothetical protein
MGIRMDAVLTVLLRSIMASLDRSLLLPLQYCCPHHHHHRHHHEQHRHHRHHRHRNRYRYRLAALNSTKAKRWEERRMVESLFKRLTMRRGGRAVTK